MTLVEFLTARLDEDEAIVRAMFSGYAEHAESWSSPWSGGVDTGDEILTIGDAPVAYHIARHDPDRALREVVAKRLILQRSAALLGEAETADIALHAMFASQATGLGIALRALAAVYADHPDYRQEWRQ